MIKIQTNDFYLEWYLKLVQMIKNEKERVKVNSANKQFQFNTEENQDYTK